MRSLPLQLALAASMLIGSTATYAADKVSADEAVALVKKANAFLKANGKEKALAEYNNPKGQFVDRDLYIFAIDMNGVTLANGSNNKLIGKNVLNMKDQDDKPFIKSFIELANSKGSGWVDYKWVHPVTKAMAMKSTYIEKVDDIVLGCGIYK